jgi:hypothetical protein
MTYSMCIERANSNDTLTFNEEGIGIQGFKGGCNATQPPSTTPSANYIFNQNSEQFILAMGHRTTQSNRHFDK